VEAFVFLPLDDARAIDPFHEHLDVAVGQLQALHHIGHAAHGVDVFRARIVDGRIMLRGQEDPLVLGQRMLQRANGRRTSNHERHHHVRENDYISEWNDWERFVDFDHKIVGNAFFWLSALGFQLSALSALS
jgi:hypothetical protein